jgi:hypothetical protein
LLFGHRNVSAYAKHFSLGHFRCGQSLSLEKHTQHRYPLSEGERKRRPSPVTLHLLHRMKNYVCRGRTMYVSRQSQNRRLGSCDPERPEIVASCWSKAHFQLKQGPSSTPRDVQANTSSGPHRLGKVPTDTCRAIEFSSASCGYAFAFSLRRLFQTVTFASNLVDAAH